MYGLVLEGGGAKGSYHIGAYKAIREMGIDIKGIAGTSVGALNGALITQGDFEKAYSLWENISYSQVMDADDDKISRIKGGDYSFEDMKRLRERVKEIVSAGGIDVTPLKKLIDEYLDEERIRASNIEFGMVTISLTDFRPLEIFLEDIPEGSLSEYLLASAYFPAFKSEKLDGKYYLDGGLYNNLPIDLLKDRGYTDIIQVRTFGMGHVKKLDTKGMNIISIEPREDLGGTLEFESERAKYNLQLGYYDGLKVLKGLKGYDYYIKTDKQLEDISEYLWNIDLNRMKLLKKTFRIKDDIDNKRALFEYIIPKISSIVGAKKEDSYEDIFYLLVENLAKYYSINRFKVYELEELVKIIKSEIINEYNKKPNYVDNFAQKVDFFSIFNKEEILKEVGFILF